MTVLAGVRVLDFTEYIAGPYGTMILGDLGADVIKVEPPEGDRWRQGQFYAPYESRNNLSLNRSKRSIALDLGTEEGKAIVYALVRTSDVAVHNFRPGVAERLGIGYETLAGMNPRLIYLHNTAFGPEGPLASRGGYDILSQAGAGFLTGPVARVENGRLTGSPGIAIGDMSAAMYSALAICAALFERERSGLGQRIDTSLLISGLAVQTGRFFSVEQIDRPPRDEFLEKLRARRAEGSMSFQEMLDLRPGPRGAQAGAVAIYFRAFETRDAPIAVACLNDRLRRRCAEVIGVKDPRFEDPNYNPQDPLYQEKARQVTEEAEAIMRAKTRDEWYELFDAAGVPCGPVNFIEEMFDDPQVLANDYVVEVEHAVLGAIKMGGPPFAFQRTPLRIERASPALSQHADEILAELGYTETQVAELRALNVVR